MFWISMAVVTFAFFVSNTLLFYFAYKYRFNKNRKATFYPVNHKLELIWTVIPAIVMAVLVFTGWRTWRDITSQAPSNAAVIELTGHQFGWFVRYAGVEDGELGNVNYKLIDDTNSLGIDFTDKNSFENQSTRCFTFCLFAFSPCKNGCSSWYADKILVHSYYINRRNASKIRQA
jgi:cytochrome c oxidase subunit 2